MIDTSKTIYQNFRAISLIRGTNDAVYFEGKKISYLKMLELTNRFASYYYSLGLTQNDLITIVAPNTPESIAAFLGASQAGIKVHLLHPLTSQENILKEFEEKNSKLLVTVSFFIRFYDKIIDKKLPTLILGLTDSLSPIKKVGFGLFNYKKLAPYYNHKELPRYKKVCKNRSDKEISYDSTSPRILLSSGGTTGASKTIELNDCSFLSTIKNGPWIINCTPEEMYSQTMLAALPMFHGFGLCMGVLTLLLSGGKIAVLPTFHTKSVIALLKKNRLQLMVGVPAVYEALLKNKHFHGKLLKNIRECFVGGDFISPSLIERYNKRLEEAGAEGKLLEGYGLTETCSVLSVNRLIDRGINSIGRPLPNITVKILDDDGNEKKANEEGEITVGGPTIMSGYFEKEDPFYYINGKRFIRTGDIGKIDENGFLYFISRKKRMIKKSGLNIYPLAIEKFTSTLPYIEECAYLGKTIKGRDYTALFVHLKEGYSLEEVEKDIRKSLKGTFNKYEIPDFIFPKEKFTHTNVGKINYLSLDTEFTNFLENRAKQK